jgi:hypothetical protein
MDWVARLHWQACPHYSPLLLDGLLGWAQINLWLWEAGSVY